MKIYIKSAESENSIDISKYKPSDKIIQKIINYRDNGSHVNVKAIKDTDKLFKYYYTAKIIDWGDLAWSCRHDAMDWRWQDNNKAIFDAIDKAVIKDDKYADTRTDIEKKYDLPSSNGLLTFEEKRCWLPKSILMYFIENKIPVHFGRRTNGSEYDRNGRQWTEIENLQIFPGTDNQINYHIAVHTNEGGGANTYTGNGTDVRVSAKKVIEDIANYIRRYSNR